MLQILSMRSPVSSDKIDASELLYEQNPTFVFQIRAPLYWWIDFDGYKFGFEIRQFDRFELRDMPVSTNVTAWVSLSYKEIVKYCTLYKSDEFSDENCIWHNEREWADFCETLLDIKGIREIVKEEN